ncbi:MAG: hypothetical protein Q9171_004634 [Xanthocarpia ochracea]
MFRENAGSLEEYLDFAAHLDSIINGTAEQFEDSQFSLDIYREHNEDTMLVALLTFIIKADRTVEAPPKELKEGERTHVQSFLPSGLITIVNKEFVRDFQGFREDGGQLDKELITSIAKESGMSYPKPGQTYGINPKKHKVPPYFQISAEFDGYLQIVEGLHHPFYVLRAYPRVEASRMRKTQLTADTLGADWKTFVFSATLIPNATFIWVHWSEVKGEDDGSTIFHMTKLKRHFLDDKQHIGAIRGTLHNILDWGCVERFERPWPWYEPIVNYDEKEKKTGAG